MYNVTKTEEITTAHLEDMLYKQMVEHFTKESEKMEDGMYPCTKEGSW